MPSYESPLYALLESRLDHFIKRGRLNVRSLAQAACVPPQTVYRWLQTNRLTSFGASLLIDVSRGKLTPEDLVTFVIES